jgi:ABC-2 type transport system ATP-binding protein
MFAWPESLLRSGAVGALASRRAGSPPLLAVEGVRRGYGTRAVLAGASLRLEAGVVAWLGGPNGAGKTTLLRIIAGVLAPDTGTVRLRGLDPEHDRRAYQRRLGYLPAGDRGLTARLTVRQQLELWAALALLGHRRRELVDATLARLELEELSDRRVERLSMGQRQRVRLALAFLHEPDVVLLDEPHTSLDEFGLALLEDALAGVTARGGAVLWCSPASAHLPLPADERYLLTDGRVERA